VRRIEALTGQAALAHLRMQEGRLAEVAMMLKAPLVDVVERVRALADERRALVNEVAQLKRDLAMGGGAGGGVSAREVNGIKLIAEVLSGVSGKDLPAMVDAMKEKLGSGVVLLIADTGAKPAVAAGVTADLTGRFSAVDVLRAAVVELGGKGGGGRADFAQGGGADIVGAEAAIKAAETLIGEK
jgi:alanyl-tRNA synthetase